MIKIDYDGFEYRDGALHRAEKGDRSGTIAYGIIAAHNISGDMRYLKLRFDAIASHDITYVGIIQTARSGRMESFPLPYILTNCHNSLCAVGGTINEDDHLFGLSAAKKYGGEFVPAHAAVIHQYMRERWSGCGRMILASDSHTRYGPAGTLAIGEGGPELAKQLLKKTYDIKYPPVMAVWLEGKPRPGVGPQDVAIALVGATFGNGAVKNKVLEFIGPGVENLSMDYRFGIDVMTTETACLSSVWRTDKETEKYLAMHGRPEAYRRLEPAEGAYYDGCVTIDLSTVEPMIAMPFHPSNAYTIREFNANAADILAECDKAAAQMMNMKEPPVSLLSKLKNGRLQVDQAFIGGCSGGTYQNLRAAADILDGHSIGADSFWLSVYPASAPMLMQLTRDGTITRLMESGASIRSAFCGPCFGAGDVPANGGISIRHSTRNFPNREGSKPDEDQIAYVALMDARSIAATARNGGMLTPADELPNAPENTVETDYQFDDTFYRSRVYYGVGNPKPDEPLILGPNITDWPEQLPLTENLLLEVASAIYDPVTTTDELIPSGETSSYRSNPVRLASFTLSRKDPNYVGRAKEINRYELMRREAVKTGNLPEELKSYLGGIDAAKCGIVSAVFALKPGDGSAREQAASSQRVLGGGANIAGDYATKRYRSNLVNWGMLPFVLDGAAQSGIKPGDKIYIEGIREKLLACTEDIPALLMTGDGERQITLHLPGITQEDAEIIAAGCLVNFYVK